jgi:hypothetical protein
MAFRFLDLLSKADRRKIAIVKTDLEARRILAIRRERRHARRLAAAQNDDFQFVRQ